jgi:hypothetical protein
MGHDMSAPLFGDRDDVLERSNPIGLIEDGLSSLFSWTGSLAIV